MRLALWRQGCVAMIAFMGILIALMGGTVLRAACGSAGGCTHFWPLHAWPLAQASAPDPGVPGTVVRALKSLGYKALSP